MQGVRIIICVTAEYGCTADEGMLVIQDGVSRGYSSELQECAGQYQKKSIQVPK